MLVLYIHGHHQHYHHHHHHRLHYYYYYYIVMIIIIIIISLMQGIYTYTPDKNHVPRQYSIVVVVAPLPLVIVVNLLYFCKELITQVLILYMLNLSHITSKFHITTMFVPVPLQTIFDV